MTEHRRKLERKDELRLYEWLKANYDRLSGKTVADGAALVSEELGLNVSSNTISAMSADMNMPPFWKVRMRQSEDESIQATLVQHAKSIMSHRSAIASVLHAQTHHTAGLARLSEVCKNLVERIESLERRPQPSLDSSDASNHHHDEPPSNEDISDIIISR